MGSFLKRLFSKASLPLEIARSADTGPLLGMLDALCRESEASDTDYWKIKIKDLAAGRAILELTPEKQVQLPPLLLWRLIGYGQSCRHYVSAHRQAINVLLTQLLRRKLPYQDKDVHTCLCLLTRNWDKLFHPVPIKPLLGILERRDSGQALPADIEAQLKKARRRIKSQAWGLDADDRTVLRRIDALLGKQLPEPSLAPSHDWAKMVQADLLHLVPEQQEHWHSLVAHVFTASGSTASGKWLQEARTRMDVLGEEEFRRRFLTWTDMLMQEKPDDLPLSNEVNGDFVKGLVWCASRLESDEVATRIRDLALYCFRKIVDFGALSTKVGNACLFALGQFPGLVSVSMLHTLLQKIRYPSARKLVEKALNESAKKNGMSRDDLDELAVPDYGMGTDGEFERVIGDYRVRSVQRPGQKSLLLWIRSDGKEHKSVPKAVKEQHGEALKDIRRLHKEIQTTLQTQARRIEGFYLRPRHWSFASWQQRYLQHPLLQHLARRLIWEFKLTAGESFSGFFRRGELVAADGQVLSLHPEQGDWEVRLWHPVGKSREEVLAWRQFLIDEACVQPFKQAHREIYILTDAELETRVYSNRFAAHVLKQHQLNALCQQRNWQYSLQGNFDSWNAPTLELPQWELSVSYEVEGAESSINEMGVFNYVLTDQVVFVRDGERLPLIDVDPLVFSEVMRDVDLFVGVCSIGNDPGWQDGGERQYVDYWQDYSFGELSVSAQSRRELLAALLPKLKIAGQCQLLGRFLVVQGSRRSYKIHLGSGNILMEPNDQYLCIVESRQVGDANVGNVFLPFEGDHRLAVILSKAFLLAADDRIKDPTILSQMRRK